MPWNPSQYNTFKEIRYKPFFDLLSLIEDNNLHHGVDIGCGTGEQTALLTQQFPNADFLGIDSSAEMLAESKKFESSTLQFKQTSIEEFVHTPGQYDLVFSNAAMQWSDDHKSLFPQLISKLSTGGQFAVQMPCQKENALNMILHDMVSEKRYADQLDGFVRHSPLLFIDEYAEILFQHGLKDITLFIKMYPIVAASETELYNFIAGSALIPYMERLDQVAQAEFSEEYKRRISNHFVDFPAMYAFKRILMYGVKV
jgi:trans-aconitate 2-methyltransferase